MHSTARALIFSRPAVLGTLFVAFVLVVGSAAVSAFSTLEISTANLRAAHAQQSLIFINQLSSTITDAETAQRGYILTHDEKYLAPYAAALPRYHDEMDALNRQFTGEPERLQVMRQLATLCEERFAEIAHTIQLRRDHGIAPALNVVESDEGWRLMNQIRQRLQLLQQQEVAEVANHTTSAAREARLFQWINGGLLALATLLAGGVAWVVIRRLSQLEGLIKVCAWTQRVQWDGRWVTFEEYLAKRFNLHCTHGISDEAARQLGREIANTPVPPEA
jgi:CHASE3 domain sensor protein